MKTTTTIKLNKRDLTKILIKCGLLPQGAGRINNAEIYFKVPSGGDYSNMNVDISEEDPITVIYSENKNTI